MTTNYREILRLKSLGLNKTDIASAAQCARNTVSATLERAKACGLEWPLPEGMSDKELAEKLFPSAAGKTVFKMPDYAHVHREMQRHGVTLTLLWLEYCDQCTFKNRQDKKTAPARRPVPYDAYRHQTDFVSGVYQSLQQY